VVDFVAGHGRSNLRKQLSTYGQTKPPRTLLLICYIGFVSLGLPDTLIGVAWPSIRRSFGLQQSDVSWIFVGGGCSYFVSSFFAGRLLKRFNVGVLLAASSALVALSGFDYSLARVWPLFALGSLLQGLGSGAIDAGLNHYVASHFSARHMNWLHACYSLGAMVGPLLMTGTIAWWNSWRLGYFVVALTLLSLAVLFILTMEEWEEPGETPRCASVQAEETNRVTAVALGNRMVWLHILLFFIYTGLEVALGQWSFTVLTEDRIVSQKVAGLWVTLYWASIFVGRVVFGFVVDRTGIDAFIQLSMVAALAGTALFAWNPFPYASPIALGLAGIGLASIFPCLMTRTPQRLGKQTAAHAIGFQVGAAMLGAAALPSATGFIAQHGGLNLVPGTIFVMALALFLLHEVVLLFTSKDAVSG
jgi:fucose permease